jgi:hypothetical protein
MNKTRTYYAKGVKRDFHDDGPAPSVMGGTDPIRLRLLKIAMCIKETASRIRLAFAANCPEAKLFRGLVGTLIPRPT